MTGSVFHWEACRNMYLLIIHIYVYRSCVRVVSSSRSGMGKSLYIQRMTDKLKEKLSSSEDVHVTVPIHGPVVTADMLLDLFENSLDKDLCTIYHIDIAPSVSMYWSIATVMYRLFSL